MMKVTLELQTETSLERAALKGLAGLIQLETHELPCF
jgi:hypothetical protein